MTKEATRLIQILVIVGLFLVLFLPWPASGATLSESVGSLTFDSMPPFQDAGGIDANALDDTAIVDYTVSRTWDAGTPVSDVIKVGDIDSGLKATDLTIYQVGEFGGIDLNQTTYGEFGVLNHLTMEELVNDLPFFGAYTVDQIFPDEVRQTLGLLNQGDASLSSIIETNPAFAQMTSGEVLGDIPINDIPALSNAQLSDFSGITDSYISQVPGLGGVSLESFEQMINTDKLMGLVNNWFPLQDIVFEEKEYHGSKATPDPVSGGTGGDRTWEAVPCSGGCPHIELHGPGWEGATWMTKAHRVKDGYGVLGQTIDEAGAYRRPFGEAFALQIAKTDEKKAEAEWGIAFRICYRTMFFDFGCTAYFIEVPLGLTTKEGQQIFAGLRDLKGGISNPIEAPAGWEDLKPTDIMGSIIPDSGAGGGPGGSPIAGPGGPIDNGGLPTTPIGSGGCRRYRTGTLSAQEYGACRGGRSCPRRHAGQDIDITQGVDADFQSFIGGDVTRVSYNPGGYGHYMDIWNSSLGLVERIAEGARLVVGLGDTVEPCQVVSVGESNTGVIHIEYRDPINSAGQGGFGVAGTYDPVEVLESLGLYERRGVWLEPRLQGEFPVNLFIAYLISISVVAFYMAAVMFLRRKFSFKKSHWVAVGVTSVFLALSTAQFIHDVQSVKAQVQIGDTILQPAPEDWYEEEPIEEGPGYYEGPFIVKNINAVGLSPVEAIINSGDLDESEFIQIATEIGEDPDEDNVKYAFTLFDYMGYQQSAITRQSDSNADWSFICNGGQLISTEKLKAVCKVPETVADSLHGEMNRSVEEAAEERLQREDEED